MRNTQPLWLGGIWIGWLMDGSLDKDEPTRPYTLNDPAERFGSLGDGIGFRLSPAGGVRRSPHA